MEGTPVSSFNMSFISGSEEASEVKTYSIKVSAGKKLSDKVMYELKTGDKIVVEGKIYTKTIENRAGQKQKIPFIQATSFQKIGNVVTPNNNIPIPEAPYIPENKIDDEEIPF